MPNFGFSFITSSVSAFFGLSSCSGWKAGSRCSIATSMLATALTDMLREEFGPYCPSEVGGQ
ncbi:hypothetical protein D3C83_157690 [compost metagenome]